MPTPRNQLVAGFFMRGRMAGMERFLIVGEVVSVVIIVIGALFVARYWQRRK
jgi:hypothetical protein